MSTDTEEDDDDEDKSNSGSDNDDLSRRHRRHSSVNNRLDEDRRDEVYSKNKKSSMTSTIEQEHIKSNRVSTLIKAVSTNSLNKQSITNTKVNKPLTQRRSDSETASNYDKAIDVLNANSSEDKATANLIKQLQHHKQIKLKAGSSSSILPSNKSTSVITNTNMNNNLDEDISNDNLATLTIAVYKMLNQLEIKFPGKTNQETKTLLQKVL